MILERWQKRTSKIISYQIPAGDKFNYMHKTDIQKMECIVDLCVAKLEIIVKLYVNQFQRMTFIHTYDLLPN